MPDLAAASKYLGLSEEETLLEALEEVSTIAWNGLFELILGPLTILLLVLSFITFPVWKPIVVTGRYFRENGRPKIRVWYLLVLIPLVLYGLGVIS